jgi:membrane-associated protein
VTELIDWAAGAGGFLYVITLALAAGESAFLFDLVVPGEVGMVLAGAAGATAGLSLPWLIVAAAVGSVLGDSFGYFVGRRWGRSLVERWAFTRRVLEPKLATAERYFERRGGVAVFVARWVGALRAVVPVVAGTSKMPYHRFLAWSATAAVMWSTVIVSLGWRFGDDMAEVVDKVGVGISLVVVAAIAIWWLRRRRQGRVNTH